MQTTIKKTATLLITCPDQKGIVATISEFLYKNKANILHCDQHQDFEEMLFLMRVEWDLKDFTLNRSEFADAFRGIAQKYSLNWEINYSEDKPKLSIFVSKYDHCLVDLLHRHQSGELDCEINSIISNHQNFTEIAQFYKIPFHYFSMETQEEKETAALAQLNILNKNKIDLIILARYMQILPIDFIVQFPKKIINIHHSFLPAFVGAKPYHRAFERGVKLIGVTSHYVTETLDDGPIIEQDVARISHRDEVSDLIQKGRDLERIVLSRAVRWHLDKRILVYKNKSVIFD